MSGSPHPRSLYLAVGFDDDARRAAYRELFPAPSATCGWRTTEPSPSATTIDVRRRGTGARRTGERRWGVKMRRARGWRVAMMSAAPHPPGRLESSTKGRMTPRLPILEGKPIPWRVDAGALPTPEPCRTLQHSIARPGRSMPVLCMSPVGPQAPDRRSNHPAQTQLDPDPLMEIARVHPLSAPAEATDHHAWPSGRREPHRPHV
ncbi:hypothetical protein THIOKS1680025 [Thiocapsa sp. KS1]|nr:hypothetical protein THIOKS1680025 [Thiocapsa sp. KS1]